ncbi:winged helix-turn-helix transcriptional regulator, partial [Listeria monocytogenes]|nr:winged helix-turn-helix transcriptional regulator [Listeria monocytogenes]
RTKTIDQAEFEKFVKRNPKLSKKDLAKHFNVTMQTVNIHLRVMNKDININIDIEELKEYIKNNPAVNMDELSKHFNVNRRQLFDVMRTYNIKYERKTPRNRKIDVEKLRTYIIENPTLSQKKLAEHFNVSLPTIDRYIKEYDLPYIPKYAPRNK